MPLAYLGGSHLLMTCRSVVPSLGMRPLYLGEARH